ncbi:MAG: HAMP domain-containing sensor histidine kinase [Gammaproteobacteria bacterium]|nr:HAMP domain-containing sensor histidine kinase [Gammaproteobacteria bacterium]
MRHLYLQIYLAFVGILVLFGVLVWVGSLAVPRDAERQRMIDAGAALVAEQLPAAGAPRDEIQAALDDLAARFDIELTLRDARGALVAATGEALPPPDPRRMRGGWMRVRGKGPVLTVRLPDGRWLMASSPRGFARRWMIGLVLLALAIAIGAYPLARRITRRLERLQRRVDRLGEGDLGTRVEVEGNDEVAELARSFNRAAERIESLVHAQRSMLASASHELRSPLARISMAVELLTKEERPELRSRIERDIRELDALIDELLLASRLRAGEALDGEEEVALLEIVAEEAARVGAAVSGSAASVRGDARSLRRMIRNLLENAQRYGGGSAIETFVEPYGGGARITVSDSGPGVPESERERIFEPFYRPPGMRESVDRGSGLGLALVREIARRHDGDVRYLPRARGGSIFEVVLRA